MTHSKTCFSPAIALILLLAGCGRAPVQQQFEREALDVGHAVGEALKERSPGAKVLVMTRPNLEDAPLSELEELLLQGLRKGLGSDVALAEIQSDKAQRADLRNEALDSGIPDKEIQDYIDSRLQSVSTWYQTRNLRDFIESHRGEADVVVSMVGLPDDLAPENFPGGDGLPGLAALNVPLEQASALLEQGVGLMYQVVRPAGEAPELPGLEVREAGAHSLLLLPSNTP